MIDHSDETRCNWCGKSFTRRRTGGRVQKYCSSRCRHGFHTAARKWAEVAFDKGDLSLDDIKAPKQRARS